MMEGTSLLALPEGMRIDQLQITEEGLIIAVAATHPTLSLPRFRGVSSGWS
jgi:transposase